MPSTYKTPGVYVEEVTKFPPSVAPVATAIPAFIGYTEKAEKNGESLRNKPTKISSLVDFEAYFGGPPPRDVIIRIDNNDQFVNAEIPSTSRQYLLYDSLRFFYNNGGGDCYIVSVGDYTNAISLGNITDPVTNPGILVGLNALAKYDEPTLIVSPDATLLSGTGMYTYQQQALRQCAELQDRFLIGDLLKSNETVAGETFDERVADFRNRIGINNLKYGAVYAPYQRTNIDPFLTFRDVILGRVGQSPVDRTTSLNLLQSLTSDAGVTQLLYDIENALTAVDDFNALIEPGGSSSLLSGTNRTLEAELQNLYAAFKTEWDSGSNTFVAFTTTLNDLYNKIRDLLHEIQQLQANLPSVVNTISVPSNTSSVDFKLSSDISDTASNNAADFDALIANHNFIYETGSIDLFTTGAELTNAMDLFGYTEGLGSVPFSREGAYAYASLQVRNDIYTLMYSTASEGSEAVLGQMEAIKTAFSITEINDDLSAAIGSATNADDVESTLSAPTDDINETVASALVVAFNDAMFDSSLGGSQANIPAVIPSSVAAAATKAIDDIIAIAQAAVNSGSDAATDIGTFVTAATDSALLIREQVLAAADAAISHGNGLIALFNNLLNSALAYETTFNSSLKESFGLYKTLLARAGQDLMVLPPSAAMAGIYTFVDATIGVWKAPANVSLSSVNAPHVIINAKEQEGLNVDPNAGKSINAIRNFTGKGILAWGARTLAGNDNEWRYVPVRRFFNFAEESIKKATEQFVFEPNDANTWVRVKAMIENFLVLQWRAGALAGAKPDQAFFVKVGLGETMTSIDILEGRMIVEIGMAVVRPAEFIILRFSHKMQES